MNERNKNHLIQLRNLYDNMQLRKKITLITIVANTLLITALIIFSVQLINKTNDKLLNSSVSNQFTDSAKTIAKSLENTTIMAESLIQNELLIQLISDPYIEVDKDKFLDIIQLYMGELDSELIGFIDLDMGEIRIPLCHSSDVRPNDTIYNALVRRGAIGEGNGRWSTRFSSDGFIFYSQAIVAEGSESEQVSGVLVVGVNLALLLEDIASKSSKDVGYALIDDSNYMVYKNDYLGDIDIDALISLKRYDYAIITEKNEDYFVVNMPLEGYSLDYYIFVPYDDITTSINYLMISYIIVITISIVLSLIISGKLISLLTKDYDQLIYKMKHFRGDGDVIVRARKNYYNRKDEIGLLHQHFDSMADDIHNLIQKNYTNEILIKEARIKAMETQINPHFLYNTLESINWRAKNIKATQISQMIESLGRLLRESLNEEEGLITIQQEMNFIDDYIYLQSLRYEEQLRFTKFIDPDAKSALIPKMTIQPLIENAIRYGLEENLDGCDISLVIRRSGNQLHIWVKNSGTTIDPEIISKMESGNHKSRGFGIGLLNIHNRLRLNFEKGYTIQFENKEDQAIIHIEIPFIVV